jgi:uncharacterized protein (UPF0332 family)
MPTFDALPEEVRLYLQKAVTKINGAELLFSQNLYDDVASRAYYGIFFAIVAALRFKNVNTTVHKHAFIINQFKNLAPQLIPAKFFSKIDAIKNNREVADYSIRQTLTRQDAETILQDAKEIIAKIRKYLEDA